MTVRIEVWARGDQVDVSRIEGRQKGATKPYHEWDGATLRLAAETLSGEALYVRLLLEQAKIADNDGTAMFPGVYRDGKRMKARVVPVRNHLGTTNDCWEIHDGTKRDGSPRIIISPINRMWRQAAFNYDDIPEFAPARAVIRYGVSGLPEVAVIRTGDEWGSDAKPVCTLATSSNSARNQRFREKRKAFRMPMKGDV